MASQIDSSYPREGNAYTQNVRNQFETARVEISDLQDAVASLQTQMSSLIADNQRLKGQQQAAAQQVSGSPPNTASQQYVTAGLNVVLTVPTNATRGYVTAEGSLGNTTNAQNSYFQLVWGDGPPPAQGTLVTDTDGTLVGTEITIAATKAGDSRPFSVSALLTNLVAGHNYWLGGAYRCDGGAATLSAITVTAFNLIDPLI